MNKLGWHASILKIVRDFPWSLVLEYIDSTDRSASRPHSTKNRAVPCYNARLHLFVSFKLWAVRSTDSLPLFPWPLRSRLVEDVRVQSFGKNRSVGKLFSDGNIWYKINICKKKVFKELIKNLKKKLQYTQCSNRCMQCPNQCRKTNPGRVDISLKSINQSEWFLG